MKFQSLLWPLSNLQEFQEFWHTVISLQRYINSIKMMANSYNVKWPLKVQSIWYNRMLRFLPLFPTHVSTAVELVQMREKHFQDSANTTSSTSDNFQTHAVTFDSSQLRRNFHGRRGNSRKIAKNISHNHRGMYASTHSITRQFLGT